MAVKSDPRDETIKNLADALEWALEFAGYLPVDQSKFEIEREKAMVTLRTVREYEDS